MENMKKNLTMNEAFFEILGIDFKHFCKDACFPDFAYEEILREFCSETDKTSPNRFYGLAELESKLLEREKCTIFVEEKRKFFVEYLKMGINRCNKQLKLIKMYKNNSLLFK